MVSSQLDSYIFSVRIVSIDYYMAPPLPGIDIGYSSFQGEKVNEVPVIRVYGSTPAGQKTCLHVHQALPYLYVPCADIPLPLTMEGNSYINTVCLAIEKALKLSGNAAAKRQHVHCSSIVRAKRFYGYHSSEELFVKIYFYNPHDIGRAAQLLLVGAVFDRSLQPHESHVPYLLQFMVDYNLYGMGHLHVNKMKFRNPIPSSFSSKLFNYNSELSQDSSKSQQEDLIGDTHLKTPVWVTSTVPENWRWQIHGDDESLSDQTIGRVKRQSVCELEGDAAVVDIVNQQFKMYQSLSQARSDLKMVQSLVPIWEEFEKMGMHVAEIPPDLGKPSSEYVLKSLSLGLELEQKLVDLCDHVESVLGLTPLEQNARTMDSIQPLSDEKKMIDFASANQSHNYSEPLQHLEERHGSLSSRDLLHEDKNAPMLAHGNYLHRDSFFIENNLSQLTNITKKATDEEALGLLKWLATSQAVEDINSDDELAPEVILSPLMPATTVDKVLEKAFMDYETESQRECQDIIDSVDNVIDFEGLEETVDSNCSGPSPKKRVPQLDGSSDDFYSFPHPESAEPSSELARTNEEKFSHKQSSHHVGKCSTKKKMNSSSWGSLPVSTTPMLLDKSETKNFDISDGSSSEDHIQNLTCCSLNTQNKSGKYLEISKDVNSLARCSVRDLMRKKRQHRFESYSSFSEQKKDLSLCPETKQLSQMLEENDGHMELWPHPCSLKQQNDVLETGNSFKTSTTVIEKLGFSAYLNCESETVADDGLKPVVPDYTCVMEEKTQVPSSKIHNPEISIKHHGMCEGSNIISKSNSDASSCKPDNLLSNMEYSYRDKLLVDSVQSVDACSFEFKESSLASELICKQMCCDDAHCDEIILRSCSSPMPFENLESHNGANEARKDLQFVCGKQVGDEAGFSTAGASSALNLMNKPSGIISISFHEKPPIVDGNYDVLDDIAPAKAVFDRSSLIPSMGFSGNVLDEIPPFFMDSFQPDKELQKLHNNGLTEDELSCHQKVVNGSPTHNLNDGSHLYLLTPIISPPSVDAINNWLSPDQGSSAPPVVSTHGSSYEDCNISVQRPNSTSIYPTPEEDVYYRKEAKSNSKTDVLDCGARIVFPSEESPAKLNIDDIFTPEISQISGPDRKLGSILLSQLGFRDPASVGAGQQLTIMSVEVQAESRGDLCPDPRFDAINVLTVALMADNDPLVEIYVLLYSRSDFHPRSRYGLSDCKVFVFVEEKQLLLHFIKIISKSNPDILVGWDVQGGSIGFLAERASYLGIGLLNLISRTPSENKMVGDYEHLNESMLENVHPDSLLTDSGLVEEVIRDEWGRTHASGLHVGGRIVLNLWRCMRCEVKLYLYTLEAVAEAVLRQKTPSIPHKILTNWFSSGSGRARYRCIEYLIKRTKLNLQILDKLDLVNRTSELARVFGIDFFSVLSRGSQYRVESMFLRLAHSQNYVAISPGNNQVASQPAMECIPLVMEPESGFYGDPVVVLDFQSLYPSMIIAYNLCFCTCLGKVSPSRENTLGVTSYLPDPHILRDLKDQIFLAPNGAMYVPPKVSRGILPRLLEEILSTRIMVKQAMKKLAPSQQVLYRIFNARQLALKLIANVTYGYTAAGFSGRMPCAELADSIVQCGRRTLENAISYVNAHTKWNARVIYGDTDSMFVLLKGRSVKDSFQIGKEIASAISEMNPDPVTLKMEKVYHPCFLLTKKRYVGYSFESADQVNPIFDAKGIETVRRDTCAAVAKAMEQTLRLYFEHQDISKVKTYLYRQWTRILSGRVTVQDFIFAKEVRLGTYSTKFSYLPPAAIVAMKATGIDPRAEPRYGERIPYVVVHGEPGARLVDMVVDPLDLLALNSPFRLNGLYYITKQIIPALQRAFGLVGADLTQWFLEMPRPTREKLGKRPLYTLNSHRRRIDSYYLSRHCVICGELVPTSVHLCSKCSQRSDVVAVALTGNASKMEREMHHLAAICQHCGGGDWVLETGVKCTSLACSVFYERRKVQKELQRLSAVATDAGFYPNCSVEWF